MWTSMSLVPFCCLNLFGWSKGGCARIACLGQLPVTKRLCSATQWSCIVVGSDQFPKVSPALCCADSCWFDIQWLFCLSWEPPESCQSFHCWSWKGKVPESTLCYWLGPCETRSLQHLKAAQELQVSATSDHGLKWSYIDIRAKQWSCKVVVSHDFAECNPGLCSVCEASLFWFLNWQSMANGSFLKFNARASQSAVVVSFAVVAILFLPIAPTPLLKL